MNNYSQFPPSVSFVSSLTTGQITWLSLEQEKFFYYNPGYIAGTGKCSYISHFVIDSTNTCIINNFILKDKSSA